MFLDFRKLLFVHYGMMFFERIDGQGYNVIGITKDFSEKYSINVPVLLLENIYSYEKVGEEISEYGSASDFEELEDNNINLIDIDVGIFLGLNKVFPRISIIEKNQIINRRKEESKIM